MGRQVLNNYRKPDLRQQRMTGLDLTAFKTAPKEHAFEVAPSLEALYANSESKPTTKPTRYGGCIPSGVDMIA